MKTDKRIIKEENDRLKELIPGTRTDDEGNNIEGHNYNLSVSDRGFELSGRQSLLADKQKTNENPFMVSVWPLVVQEDFKDAFFTSFPGFANSSNQVVTMSGSMYHDNVFYKFLEGSASIDAFPDILVTTDFNSIYHRPFMDRFLNSRYFERIDIHSPSIFTKAGWNHFSSPLKLIASDLLVMVINKSKFLYRGFPREWYELLNPSFKGEIIVPDDRDFFCNTFYYYYVKNFGYGAIRQLVSNTCMRAHPQNMVKQIEGGNPLEASVFVLPYSYAKDIEDKFGYQIVWPEDGAIMIPVQMLVKRGAYEKYKRVVDFLTGPVLGSVLQKHGVVSANAKVFKRFGKTDINWVGWEFLEAGDLGSIKRKIREHFE